MFVGSSSSLREVERRRVVELLARDLRSRTGSTFSTLPFSCGVLGRAPSALVGSSTQSSRRSTDERQDDLAVLGLLVVAAQQVGDRPDEGGVVAHILRSRSGHDLLSFSSRSSSSHVLLPERAGALETAGLLPAPPRTPLGRKRPAYLPYAVDASSAVPLRFLASLSCQPVVSLTRTASGESTPQQHAS